jgi:hypothetical protein
VHQDIRGEFAHDEEEFLDEFRIGPELDGSIMDLMT